MLGLFIEFIYCLSRFNVQSARLYFPRSYKTGSRGAEGDLII